MEAVISKLYCLDHTSLFLAILYLQNMDGEENNAKKNQMAGNVYSVKASRAVCVETF